MTAVSLLNLAFAYPRREPLFSDLDLDVLEGECVALCGPSGGGKSTLCHLIAGIIPRSINGSIRGEIKLFGKPVSAMSLSELVQSVGIVFQNPDSQLFSPTVEDEVAFGPENLCLPRDEIGQRIDWALSSVGMERFRLFNPNDLSGGQKQLIALAAVLALKPRLLLFDEALSQLDDESTARILGVIESLRAGGHTVLMVEHDEENLCIADRVLRLSGGQLEEVRDAGTQP